MKAAIWTLWIFLTVALLGYFANQFFFEEHKSALLIGEATYGHYQIEMTCDTCHTEAFGGEELLQDACTSCHAEELKAAHDSHPRKKFTDPRNADLLEIIDARYCVSCHTEHQHEQTGQMGLTLPEDYCFHCHEDVIEERESHKDLAFDSCASAGCHNYHDNKALYESFLVDNANQPWLKEMARISEATSASYHATKIVSKKAQWQSSPEQEGLAQRLMSEAKQKLDAKQDIHHDFIHQDFIHLEAGVGCQSCHAASSPQASSWLAKPGVEQCQSCHEKEAKGFLESRHGMKLAAGLSAMTPEQSKAHEFLASSGAHEQNCQSCHKPHSYDRAFASTQACLTCHQDDHSLAFEHSAHANLGDEALSCATCHLPRVEDTDTPDKRLRVEHNQNMTLRPNEKMIRPVCMQCHSLEFSIDALADENLIKSNFNGRPEHHIPSIDWAMERENRN